MGGIRCTVCPLFLLVSEVMQGELFNAFLVWWGEFATEFVGFAVVVLLLRFVVRRIGNYLS